MNQRQTEIQATKNSIKSVCTRLNEEKNRLSDLEGNTVDSDNEMKDKNIFHLSFRKHEKTATR